MKILGNILFIHSYDMTQRIVQEPSEMGFNVDDMQLLCGVCEEKSAILVWDDRYAGFRGRCRLCRYDWPES